MRGQFPIHVLVVALLCLALGAPSLSRGQAAAPCDDECLQARRTAAGAKGFPEAGPPVLLEGADGASADKLAAQFEALSSIENASVHYDARGVPRFISGKTTFLVPNDLKLSDSGEVLAPVIAGLRSLLLAEGTETLSVESVGRKHLLRGTGVVLRQSIRGIPVTDAQIVLTTDERTQRVIRISAHFLPDRGLAREPQISAEEASSRAFAWVREFKTLSDNPLTYRDGTRDVRTEDADRPSFLIDEVTLGAPPQLAYIIGRAHVSSDARLTWQVELHRNKSPFKGLVIDAVDGSVIAARDRTYQLTRHVYDAERSWVAPGALLFSEGNPNTNPVAVNAYLNVGRAIGALAPVVADYPALESVPFRISIRYGTSANAYAGSLGQGFQDVLFGPSISSGVCDKAPPGHHTRYPQTSRKLSLPRVLAAPSA